jgi:signal transduction histidine kinase/DNA-binding response OmpR family regulator
MAADEVCSTPASGSSGSENADTDASRAVSRLRIGAWLISGVIAFGMPAIHAQFGVRSVEQLMIQETDRLAERMSAVAGRAPGIWVFQDNEIRLEFEKATRSGTLESARLIGPDAQISATIGPWSGRAFFEHTTEVFESGVVVGSVATRRSAKPLAMSIAWTAAAALLFAVGAFVLVTRVGVRSIERTVQQLQAARDAAIRAGEARKTFLATMSHEIRTPMNGVIGMTSLLRDTPMNEEQRRYVEVIRSSGESLLRVINEILEFAKIESARIVLEPHVFQPMLLVEEVLVLLEPLSRHKDLKLVLEAGPGVPPWVETDVNRLRQVLVNLVGNAIKFSERGPIRVRVECPAAGRLAFIVQDNGIGMSPEQIQVVFDPFVQADASTGRRFGGTGLGLAISSRLVNMMNGTLRVRSELGRGSTFTAEVQAAPAQPPQGRSPAAGFEILVGKRVLLVADQPGEVEIVESMVRGWGMLPISETDPQAAMARLASGESAIDVVVLDSNLNGLDGPARGRRLRDSHPDLPLVLLTSASGTNLDAGLFDACVRKPVSDTLLRDALRSVLTGTATSSAAMLSQSAIDGSRLAAGAPSRAGLQVLVAEDNAVNAMVISAMLQRLGIACDMAGNGLEAVEAVERQHYDIVFMDMQMPELDGLEATRRVRSNRALRQPLIVALTANAMIEDRERCLAVGMNEFLAKPLQLHDLEQCLAALIPNVGRITPQVPDGP